MQSGLYWGLIGYSRCIDDISKYVIHVPALQWVKRSTHSVLHSATVFSTNPLLQPEPPDPPQHIKLSRLTIWGYSLSHSFSFCLGRAFWKYNSSWILLRRWEPAPRDSGDPGREQDYVLGKQIQQMISPAGYRHLRFGDGWVHTGNGSESRKNIWRTDPTRRWWDGRCNQKGFCHIHWSVVTFPHFEVLYATEKWLNWINITKTPADNTSFSHRTVGWIK